MVIFFGKNELLVAVGSDEFAVDGANKELVVAIYGDEMVVTVRFVATSWYLVAVGDNADSVDSCGVLFVGTCGLWRPLLSPSTQSWGVLLAFDCGFG